MRPWSAWSWTAATWSTKTPARAAQSLPLVSVDRWKTDRPSARAFRALPSWKSTKVVNARVRASASFPRPPAHARTPSVPAAMTSPVITRMPRRRTFRMAAPGRRGGASMAVGDGGSTPRAIAGGPSMMMLTQRIWMTVKGTGSPSSGAPRSDPMAPRFVASWKRTKVTMLA